jgi:hypothetical protein
MTLTTLPLSLASFDYPRNMQYIPYDRKPSRTLTLPNIAWHTTLKGWDMREDKVMRPNLHAPRRIQVSTLLLSYASSFPPTIVRSNQ